MEIRHTGNLKIFSETASINESSAFGTTTNTDDINTLLNTNFQKGWENGVDEDGFPLRKWFNGKDKALTKLIAYLYQQGTPAYDSTQKYYVDSVCTYNGKAYISLVGTESTPNIGNVPTSSIGTSWNILNINYLSGAISNILTSNLTASRALVSDASGKISVSSITSTILGYLSGVTSDIQTQINDKAPTASPTFTGDPKSVTPAQFDNYTSIATTAFVQRALGSLSGVVAISNNINIDSSYTGKHILVSMPSNGYTVGLPLESSLAQGATFTFTNYGNYTVGITTQAGNTYSGLFNGSTNFYLNPKETVTISLESTAGYWNVIGGSALLKYSGSFGASLSGNGYQKLPSGLIIQWGQVNLVASNTAYTVTFPVAYTTSNIKINTTLINSGLSGSCYSWHTTPTTTQFSIIGATALYCDWVAIGY